MAKIAGRERHLFAQVELARDLQRPLTRLQSFLGVARKAIEIEQIPQNPGFCRPIAQCLRELDRLTRQPIATLRIKERGRCRVERGQGNKSSQLHLLIVERGRVLAHRLVHPFGFAQPGVQLERAAAPGVKMDELLRCQRCPRRAIQRLGVMLRSFLVRIQAERRVASDGVIFDGTLPVVGGAEVVSQHNRLFLKLVREQRLNRLADPLVIFAPVLAQDAAVCQFLDQRLAKYEFDLRQPRGQRDQIHALQIAQLPVELPALCKPRAGVANDHLQHPVVKRTADQCGQLQRMALGFIQPVDAGHQQRLERVGDVDNLLVVVRRHHPVGAVVTRHDCTFVLKRSDHLFEEKGIARGSCQDGFQHRLRQINLRQQLVHQRNALLLCQRRQLNLGIVMREIGISLDLDLPAGCIPVGPQGTDKQNRQAVGQLEKVNQQIDRRLIGPVEIIAHNNAGVVLGPYLQQRRDDFIELFPERLAIQRRAVGLSETKERSQRVLHILVVFRRQHGRHELSNGSLQGDRRLAVRRAQHLAQKVLKQAVGTGRLVGEAESLVPAIQRVAGRVCNRRTRPALPLGAHLCDEAAFAHPHFADDGDNLTVAAQRPVDSRGQIAPRLDTSDQRQSRVCQSTQPAGGHDKLQHAIAGHRLRLALDIDTANFLDLKLRGNDTIGALGNLDRAGLRSLLHTRRHVDRVPHRRILRPQIRPDVANHHQPGVDAHPHIEVDAPVPLDFLSVGRNAVDNIQTRQDCPLWIVLM